MTERSTTQKGTMSNPTKKSEKDKSKKLQLRKETLKDLGSLTKKAEKVRGGAKPEVCEGT